MSALAISMVVLLALVETLASYMSRVYAEFGKILAREIEENLDAWEELIEPQRADAGACCYLRGSVAATGSGNHRARIRRSLV